MQHYMKTRQNKNFISFTSGHNKNIDNFKRRLEKDREREKESVKEKEREKKRYIYTLYTH